MEETLTTLGEPRYRVRQINTWVYKKLACSFEEMTDLPQPLRQKLAARFGLSSLNIICESSSRDGTTKVLFALPDDRTIESTLMPYPSASGGFRYTVCLSTQVGCPVGCAFCATGQQGYERNLSAAEIIDQVLFFARRLKESRLPERISNLVFMGMGEPLANYDVAWKAIERLNSAEGFGLGARNMVISTAGLVPGIKHLSRESLQVGLAVSLHAADNALRDRLVPLNRRYPLEELIAACRDYFERTGRRPSFEYVLFEGINDSIEQAALLARLLAGLNCHVNLITASCTAEGDFRPSPREKVFAFEKELKRHGINCTRRQGRGLDIEAGCGQLCSRVNAA
jgi:23S rRNA (adenine2503-C2)-methyltransferase